MTVARPSAVPLTIVDGDVSGFHLLAAVKRVLQARGENFEAVPSAAGYIVDINCCGNALLRLSGPGDEPIVLSRPYGYATLAILDFDCSGSRTWDMVDALTDEIIGEVDQLRTEGPVDAAPRLCMAHTIAVEVTPHRRFAGVWWCRSCRDVDNVRFRDPFTD